MLALWLEYRSVRLGDDVPVPEAHFHTALHDDVSKDAADIVVECTGQFPRICARAARRATALTHAARPGARKILFASYHASGSHLLISESDVGNIM